MLLKVLKPFIDKHTKETYEVGQEIEVTEKRGFEIIYNPQLGPSFVEPVLENEDDAEGTGEFPQSKGGGYYLLSNGETVQGKEAAIAAEELLAAE